MGQNVAQRSGMGDDRGEVGAKRLDQVELVLLTEHAQHRVQAGWVADDPRQRVAQLGEHLTVMAALEHIECDDEFGGSGDLCRLALNRDAVALLGHG